MNAMIHTAKGKMLVELYNEDAPLTVANFAKLAGIGFYDNFKFHRVISNFMVQTGCPDGDGKGDPGYTIPCELKGDRQYHDRGTLSMANKGYRNSGGSQFFICISREATKHLDGKHTCFGRVIAGLEVIDLVEQGDLVEKIYIIESVT
jgi:peptidyl-prolyl cis-trans isomerase B (cyclophilin B)